MIGFGHLGQRRFESRSRHKHKTLCAITLGQMSSSKRPTLKQFIELRQSDFDNYPIWVNCHVIDYDEEWYDDTDEETFRPWTGDIPVSPDDTMYLVAASFQLNDRTIMNGFLTPDIGLKRENELGNLQPNLLTTDGPIGFWTGMFSFDDKRKNEIYKRLNKTADQIFPIRFSSLNGLSSQVITGTINGFLTIEDGKTIKVSH